MDGFISRGVPTESARSLVPKAPNAPPRPPPRIGKKRFLRSRVLEVEFKLERENFIKFMD
jgi:hypothetical protein